MPDWKILIADGLEDAGQSVLRASADVEDRRGITPEELIEEVGEYDALIIRGRTKVTPPVFKAAGRLKVIGRAGVGVDNIDLAAATAHSVTVVNAPTATTQAVAELVMGLMFSLARKIPRADADMKTGQWTKKELEGIELDGKALGVIGMGNIGRRVANLAAAIGMMPLGYDPLLAADEVKRRGAEPVSLNDLYARSDFITVHVPLLPETRNLISGQALGQMKRGVYLVCAARGGIIDETALLGALESGQVAGAALDVFKQEPPGISALVAHPSVVATPHIGAQTAEAQKRAAQDIAEEVLAALREEPLRWKVV